ncbi:hypothetical protein CesoFtcFv8_019279 [Champsocephalus esox]|uniref:Uncharacterized protein n=1 Tax=Champsocephalus esox TaxID=159716 RepID=A0AAN8BI73_9TELE|nr:hypothetical protein CesoFtcFv8_019279 [Champsocephalus esox]
MVMRAEREAPLAARKSSSGGQRQQQAGGHLRGSMVLSAGAFTVRQMGRQGPGHAGGRPGAQQGRVHAHGRSRYFFFTQNKKEGAGSGGVQRSMQGGAQTKGRRQGAMRRAAGPAGCSGRQRSSAAGRASQAVEGR